MLVVIPARGGSKRIPNKALKVLGMKPLLLRAIDRARRIQCRFVVASEDAKILEAAKAWSAETWYRDPATATDDAPDYSWAKELPERYPEHDRFCILRITSPFFTAGHVHRQIAMLTPEFTSIRAATKATAHPAKMWWHEPGQPSYPAVRGEHFGGIPWHSAPTQTLPAVYQQTAGCEVVWAQTLRDGSLAGDRVGLYVVDGPAALDINTPEDWARAEEIAKTWTA